MNSAGLPRLQIVILAAGFSARLGRPKALTRVHGTTLLRRTLCVVARLTRKPIVIVLPPKTARYRVETKGPAVRLVGNARRSAGLSSSVCLAIARARYAPALLFVPVDLVALRRREIAALISRWRANPRRVIARRVGSDPATPLILPRWLYGAAGEITGDAGLRELVRDLPPIQRVLMNMASAGPDVDTPEDLSAARRIRSN